MGRPIEATQALDLDTIKLLLWASEYGSGKPNISLLYENEVHEGLHMARGTFFGAIKGRRVTQDTIQKVDELIALRGWQSKYIEHLRDEHKKRVLQAFGKPVAYCSICGHACQNCGAPNSEQRRKAIKGFLKLDPLEVGGKVRDREE